MINKIYKTKNSQKVRRDFMDFRRSTLLTSPSQMRGGFSLVETLVAVSILLMSIAGPMTIAQRSLSSARISVDQVTAFYLGQEAVEGIRHIRDSNVLAGNIWLAGLDACIDGSCTIDVKENDDIDACQAVGQCPIISKHTSNDLYGYGNGAVWEPTKFNRDIQIETINANEIVVKVTVSWTHGLLTKDVTMREHLFNWQ